MKTNGVTLRQANADDFEAVRDLLRDGDRYHRSLGVFSVRSDPEDYQPETFAQTLASETQAVFLAHCAGDAVGFIRLEEFAKPQGRFHAARSHAEVHEIVIAEAFRGSGVGTLLIDAAKQWSEQRRLPSLELNCFGSNAVARFFYSQRGFEEQGIRFRLDLTKPQGSHP